MKLCPYCHNPLNDADVNQLQAEKKELQAENAELGRAAHDLLSVALLLCDPTQCEECKCLGPSTKTCALAQIIERLEELGVRV